MSTAILAAGSNAPRPPKAQWVSIKWRFLCIAVTIAALVFIFHRIPAITLLETFRAMRIGWFIAAFVLYGIMFLPAAWRWHLALRLNKCVVTPSATLRFSVIGHFFYLVLFGAAGGDAAKGAVYARRHEMPLPKILAAVWLDRLMGSGALILISAMAFAVTGLHGGFAGTKSFSINASAWWLLLVPAAMVLLVIFFKRSRRDSIFRRFAEAFFDTGRRLIASPKIVLKGLLCSLLMQVALNGVLALNLQAVSHAPIPWWRLVWTFPLITAISGLPVTVAGIGARDGAAIALLGWCGVMVADAEATSLLTLLVSVLWGVIGGILLWRESDASAAPTKPTPLYSGLPRRSSL